MCGGPEAIHSTTPLYEVMQRFRETASGSTAGSRPARGVPGPGGLRRRTVAAMTDRDPELKKEIDATLQTRKELGPEYEDELVESFLGKLEHRIDEVVDKRVRRQLAEQQMVVARGNSRPRHPGTSTPSLSSEGVGARLGLAVASLVLAIPLSAIAAVNAGMLGLLVCWGGVVGVNALQASRDWFTGGARDHGAERRPG